MNLEERFWSHVSGPNQNGCREYMGTRRLGYGRFRWFDGSLWTAHRAAWTLTYGAIPDGMNVLHNCDNPPCCEPTHLFLGTDHDNIIDALTKGRWNPANEKYGAPQLTKEQVKEIRHLILKKESQRKIAKQFKVSRMTIYKIAHSIIWKGADPMEIEEIILRAKTDPVFFCRLFFKFNPYSYQQEFWKACQTYDRIAILWGRGSGKTTAVAMLTIWFAFANPGVAWQPNKIVITAPAMRQAKQMFDQIAPMINSEPILQNSVIRQTRTEIWFSNHAIIVCVPLGTDGKNVRGNHPMMVIVDEAAFVKGVIFDSVLFPMMNILLPNGGHRRLVMLTTAWGSPAHPFRKAYTLDSRYWKMKIRSTDCPNADKVELASQKSNNPYVYKIENDCDWPDEESAWLRADLLLRITEGYDLIGEISVLEGEVKTGRLYRHFVGIDLGKKESYTVITVWREEQWKDGKQVYRLVYFKRFPRILDIPKDLQKDYNVYVPMEKQFKMIVEKFNVVWAAVDLGAAGEAEVEHLRMSYPGIQGFALSEPRKRDTASWMRSMMESGKVRIPTMPNLIAVELSSEQYEEREGGAIHFYPAGEEDDKHNKIHNPDDIFWSAALGLYGTHPVTTDNPPFGFAKL